MNTRYIADTAAYIHRKIAGEHILIPVGHAVNELNGVITLNTSAAFLWDALKTPVSKEQLIDMMGEEYEADQNTLKEDVKEILNIFLNRNMVTAICV